VSKVMAPIHFLLVLPYDVAVAAVCGHAAEFVLPLGKPGFPL